MRLSLTVVMALTLFAGCRSDEAIDGDGDGAFTETDCNDADAAIGPTAIETCNGVDDNCNGLVDDNASDATSWYADDDGDTYGHPAGIVRACDQPLGFVADSTDCDDTDSATHPGAVEIECTSTVDVNCDGSVGYADADGDGYPACGDCDDTSAGVNPEATEVCDGIDNNCSGTADEAGAIGESVWYADADSDGYGDVNDSQVACDQPQDYVRSNSDCNDNESEAFPGNTETCDGADNDCNGTVDGADANNATLFYVDSDGDGSGNGAAPWLGCTAPAGYTTSGDDCDDNNADAYPGNSEVCDGSDSDCNGATDDGVGQTYYIDYDGDGYGVDAVSQVACSQPTGYSNTNTDCDDLQAASNPGAIEICDGIDNSCAGLDAAEADADFDGFRGCEGDCDDTDSSFNPAAGELYDALDHNCDGDPGDDLDGDGVAGLAAGGSDCDDNEPLLQTDCDNGGSQANAGASCLQLMTDYGLPDGDYWIDPDFDGGTANAFEVTCDMTNGGWTYDLGGGWFTVPYSAGPEPMQTVAVDAEYHFRLYGAEAGLGDTSSRGGDGGMTEGSRVFTASTGLWLYVGGQGEQGGQADQGASSTHQGGWNGGGRATRGGSGGGGATDLRIIDPSDLNNRILVAGGGGGCGNATCASNGGHGGGLTGNAGSGGSQRGRGGTQTAGGTSTYGSNGTCNGKFGQGGNNRQANDEGGGGGGWWGGASGCESNSPAGGGSSYYDGMTAMQATTVGGNTGNGWAEYIFK